MSNKKQVFLTPKGIALYPWLTTPDKQFNPEGDYKVELKLDPNDPEVEKFIDGLADDVKAYFTEAAKKDKAKAGLAKTARVPVHADVERDTGQETGLVVVKFKSGFKPGLFDSMGSPIVDDIRIGSGSIIRVAFSKNFYDAFGGGMNLYLQQVQIIKFVEYNARGVSAFDAVEGGFQADQPAPAEEFGGNKDEDKVKVEDDDLPFDKPQQKKAPAAKAEDDPRDEKIDKALVEDTKFKLADRCAAAKLGFPELRELWDSKKGNPAMFRISLNNLLKQKGV